MAIFFNPTCGSCDCNPPGDSTLWAGGSFSTIGGLGIAYLAKLDSDGVIDTGFVCTLDDFCNDLYLDVTNNVLWVGGDFTTVGGVTHKALVVVNADTGALVFTYTFVGTFTSPALGTPLVSRLYADTANGYMYASGDFRSVNGTSVYGVCRFNLTTGAFDSTWAPVITGGIATTMKGVAVLGTSVYLSGNFTGCNATVVGGFANVDTTTGTTTGGWNPALSAGAGGTDVLPVSASSFIITGGFSVVNSGGVTRAGLCEVDATGTATSWNPGAPILNGPDGHRVVACDGISFYCTGGFVNAAAVTVLGAIARFLYAGAADTSFQPPLPRPSNVGGIFQDASGSVYVGDSPVVRGGLYRLSGVDGSHDAAFPDLAITGGRPLAIVGRAS